MCEAKLCALYLLAEGSKRIQPLLVLGGVTHHGVVTTFSLQHGQNKRQFNFPPNQRDLTNKRVRRGVSDALCPGSSAGIWFSRRVWCCLLSGCPVHSAGPAWSAAWSGSPAGIRGNRRDERGGGIITPGKKKKDRKTTSLRASERDCDSQLPAPGCGSGTSPFGWRWWRAESPSGPEEAQDEGSRLNLQITQSTDKQHRPRFTSSI